MKWMALLFKNSMVILMNHFPTWHIKIVLRLWSHVSNIRIRACEHWQGFHVASSLIVHFVDEESKIGNDSTVLGSQWCRGGRELIHEVRGR